MLQFHWSVPAGSSPLRQCRQSLELIREWPVGLQILVGTRAGQDQHQPRSVWMAWWKSVTDWVQILALLVSSVCDAEQAAL